MRAEDIMKVVAENHGQSFSELVEELGVGPEQLKALVQYIVAACGRQ